jgi:tetratricopeptide (TPR) repeat protein
VRREVLKTSAPENSKLVTPFQVMMETEEDAGKGKKKQKKTSTWVANGRVMVSAEEGNFRIELGSKPKVFWLGRNMEVLAEFYDDSYFPQQRVVDQGLRLMNQGDLAGAEKQLREALKTPRRVESEGRVALATRRDEENEARIHLYLARLHLDQGKVQSAEADLGAARKGAGSRNYWLDPWITRTEARIEILKGDFDAAFRRLNKLMLRRDRSDSTEGYLLLAIAAKQVGKADVLKKALREATKQGAKAEVLAEAGP